MVDDREPPPPPPGADAGGRSAPDEAVVGRVTTELPRGAFPVATTGGPFAHPSSSTPSPPPALPPIGTAASATPEAPDTRGAPWPSPTVLAPMPSAGSATSLPIASYSAPAGATPAPPAPTGRWPEVDPRRPSSTPVLPASPPLYDPQRYSTGFGAAGAAPPLGLALGDLAQPSMGVPPLPLPAAAALPPARPNGAPSVRTAVLVGVLSAVIASVITAGVFLTFGRSGSTTGATSAAGNGGSPPASIAGNSLDIHGLLDKARPSVVTIRTDATEAGSKTPLAAGSGIIISADGLVLTNAHVITGASAMKVILVDGTAKGATLVGSLPDDDVALIRITDPPTLVPAVLGDSTDLKVGDPVVAIGNALNLGGSPSVTEGIVSAKDRDIQTKEGYLTNLIQTDAAINPGNSGGPLLNAAGQVVGVNTAIIDNAQNIGFAIAIDAVKPQIDELENGKGTVTPQSGFLGVSTQSLADVTDTVLQKYHVTASSGAFMSDVVAGSAAAAAGLQPGDVITAIDGKPVTAAADVGTALRGKNAGDSVIITYEREGQTATATATLKTRSETGN